MTGVQTCALPISEITLYEKVAVTEIEYEGGILDSKAAVTHWRREYRTLREGGAQRTSVEMGLVGVLATQLWHQTYIDAGLADVPAARPIKRQAHGLQPVGLGKG